MVLKFTVTKCEKAKGKLGVFFVGEDLKLEHLDLKHDYQADFKEILKLRTNFKGKKGDVLSFVPGGKAEFQEVLVMGYGKADKLSSDVARSLGGKLVSYLNSRQEKEAVVCPNLPTKGKNTETCICQDLYFGAASKNYRYNDFFFDKKDDNKVYLESLEFCVHKPDECKKALDQQQVVMEAVTFSRNLVSQPGNVLYPETFVAQCKMLAKMGVKLKVLGKKEMTKLGMHALLGVAQGSEKDPYVLIMEWNGNPKAKKEAPVAFLGKGVTFDSGGISIKPSQNMGDMKYDMAGAGAVAGLMHVLAGRKAKVNAIGVVGLVENMPSGTAQRPGDVVISYSGQSIEIDNTDAEGRLVLADILWYTQKHYKPKFMINLATLTGAMVVALGENLYGGLFSNDDELAKNLEEAGKASGEWLWRLPLDDFYDKQINSEIADIRNTGSGRGAGSITAAQFLQRFVNKLPWAHLDIAGMAWDKSGSDIISKGATGYGVRLLNQLVSQFYETK